MRWGVVLAGGVGSRFWPVSTALRPKQLLPLAGDASLLAQTVARLAPLIPPERILIVTSRALAEPVRRAVPMVPAANVLGEPRAASTAPALAWASGHAAHQDPDASILSLHADWAVKGDDKFRKSADTALTVAESRDVLVTVGARPTRPETGYGYIVPGKTLGGGARAIRTFVEKPAAPRARKLIAARALWNTGMFAWTARRLFAEMDEHTPELHAALPRLRAGDASGYESARPVSIDVGVFERTRRGAVIAGTFGWDDVGSWAALPRVRKTDKTGNVTMGPVHVADSKRSIVWSEDGAVAVFGMEDVVVVRANGVTLVTTRDKAPDLKKLLDRLPRDLAGERGA